jgi:hypothetical protein
LVFEVFSLELGEVRQALLQKFKIIKLTKKEKDGRQRVLRLLRSY